MTLKTGNNTSFILNVPSEFSGPNYQWYISSQRILELRETAFEAINKNTVFAVTGKFNSIRNSLLNRGWVEKILNNDRSKSAIDSKPSADFLYKNLPDFLPSEMTQEQYMVECERIILSRMLGDCPINFLWRCRSDNAHKNAIIRSVRSSFTSKRGLNTQINKNMDWNYEPNLSHVNYPRSYQQNENNQHEEFREDFQLTACMSLLRYFIHAYETQGVDSILSPGGTLQFDIIPFAITQCQNFIAKKLHDDIDKRLVEPTKKEWLRFLNMHHLFVHNGKRFSDKGNISLTFWKKRITMLLEEMQKVWSQYDLDGMLNIWIVKPFNSSRGIGIHLVDNMNIINRLFTTLTWRYVIQKYIETPLLIYDTKFDIRQWFLVSSKFPLQIWMYRKSYLRFSSQPFCLTNKNRLIHLTNNSVQKHSKEMTHLRITSEKMWDSNKFQDYLKENGKENIWETVIYPGMKENIIGAMLASQTDTEEKNNNFALYGADFLLTPDFKPWLLEINASPQMAATTSVTAKLCPQCLEDLLKVIVDRTKDPSASTGEFELIYDQKIPPLPNYSLKFNLTVQGKKIEFPRSHSNLSNHSKQSLPKLQKSRNKNISM